MKKQFIASMLVTFIWGCGNPATTTDSGQPNPDVTTVDGSTIDTATDRVIPPADVTPDSVVRDVAMEATADTGTRDAIEEAVLDVVATDVAPDATTDVGAMTDTTTDAPPQPGPLCVSAGTACATGESCCVGWLRINADPPGGGWIAICEPVGDTSCGGTSSGADGAQFPNATFHCDGPRQCGANQVCCGTYALGSQCVTGTTCGAGDGRFCLTDSDCATGTTCSIPITGVELGTCL